jgi:DNA-binding CsgD family transcriptional regulator/PAS domain-containing protein
MHDTPSDLIADLYDMATGGAAGSAGGVDWQAITNRLAHLTDSQSATLRSASATREAGILGTYGCGTGITEAYEAYFHQHDVFRQPFRSFQPGELLLSQDYVADEELARSEFYNDFLSFSLGGAFYNAGAYWELPGQRLLFVGVQRTRRAGPLPKPAADVLRQVWPHLPRALQLTERMRGTRATQDLGFDALDLLPTGVVVLEANRRVAFVNRTAERLMREAGMTLRLGSSLRLPAAEEDDHLAQLIWRATRRDAGIPPLPGAMRCTRAAAAGPPLSLLVAPFQPRQHRRSEGSQPLAMVLMTAPPSQSNNLSGQIAQLFGLSPSEAEVAVALAGGLSPEEIARDRRVPVLTIRSQIKSAMFKTGTRRQGELIRLLLSLPRLAG